MYKISKESSVFNIKADVKNRIVADFIEYLTAKYGEDSVGMIRTGDTSKINEIGFIFDEVADEQGEVNPIVVSINPTVKEIADRKTDKRTYTAFDFVAAREAYNVYVEEKEAKAAEQKKANAEKAKKDAERREKAKREREEKFS